MKHFFRYATKFVHKMQEIHYVITELPGKLSLDPHCFINDLKKFYRKKSWLLKNAKIDNSFNFMFFVLIK
jgi:hypothetical protein